MSVSPGKRCTLAMISAHSRRTLSLMSSSPRAFSTLTSAPTRALQRSLGSARTSAANLPNQSPLVARACSLKSTVSSWASTAARYISPTEALPSVQVVCMWKSAAATSLVEHDSKRRNAGLVGLDDIVFLVRALRRPAEHRPVVERRAALARPLAAEVLRREDLAGTDCPGRH